MRLIDADMLVQAVNNQAAFESKKSWTVGEIKTLIKRQPTAQVDNDDYVVINGYRMEKVK